MTTTLSKQLSVQDKTTFAQLAQKLHADRDNMQTLLFRRVINGVEIVGYLPFRLVPGEPMVRALHKGARTIVDCSPAGSTDLGINSYLVHKDKVHPSHSALLIKTRQALAHFADFLAERRERIERDWLAGAESQADQLVPAVHRAARDIPVLAYLQQLDMIEHCSMAPLSFVERAIGHPLGFDERMQLVRLDADRDETEEESRGYPGFWGEELRTGDSIDSWAPAQVIDDPVLVTRAGMQGRGAWQVRTRREFDGWESTRYVLDSSSLPPSRRRWAVGCAVELVSRDGLRMDFQRDDDYEPIWQDKHRELIGEYVAAHEARLTRPS